MALIALLLQRQALNLQALYLIAFCFGVADAFTSPALRVLLPELVTTEQLQRANALLQSSMQVCVLAGSAVGGLLIAHYGLLFVFIADAASYAYIIIVLLCMAARPRAATPGAEAGGIMPAIAAGLRYVWRDAGLRAVLISFASINFCATGATQIGLVVLAGERHGSPGLGLLMACAGAGAGSLLGLALAAKWRSPLTVHRSAAAASFALSLLLAGLALPLPLWCVGLDAALLGAVAGYVNIQVLSWLQGSVRSDMLGRTMSVLALASVGITPLSLAAAGLLAQSGTGALFLGAGTLLLLTSAALWRHAAPPATRHCNCTAP